MLRQLTEGANSGQLFILSGPSGVGKDAAIKRLKAQGFPLHYTVTATTRPIRDGEVNGLDYIFLTPLEFEELQKAGGFLESVTLYGNSYGTPLQQVVEALKAGEDVLLKIDTQGAQLIRQKMPEAVLIFLAPPSFEELKQRLTERSTESPDALGKRLRNVEAEMASAGDYDHVVYNNSDQLDDAVAEIKRIVLEERGHRASR